VLNVRSPVFVSTAGVFQTEPPPPCPAAASKLSGLAVEPILDILSDRL